jgi:hypothetical protein
MPTKTTVLKRAETKLAAKFVKKHLSSLLLQEVGICNWNMS